MYDPNRTQTHTEALAYHALQVERDAQIDADNAEYDARQAKITDILAEISEGSMVDAVSVQDLALAREVIAAGKGSVTWSSAGKSWARLCRAQPGSVYPPL
jgi:hypothetical protein